MQMRNRWTGSLDPGLKTVFVCLLPLASPRYAFSSVVCLFSSVDSWVSCASQGKSEHT